MHKCLPPIGVEDGIHPITREAVYLLHEVLALVINRNPAQLGNGLRSAR
jgi:hypothetical protein